jgi:hypothetical protein
VRGAVSNGGPYRDPFNQRRRSTTDGKVTKRGPLSDRR